MSAESLRENQSHFSADPLANASACANTLTWLSCESYLLRTHRPYDNQTLVKIANLQPGSRIMQRSTILKIVLLTLLLLLSDTLCESASAAKDSSKSKSLFNGKNLDGWHADVPKLDNDPDAKPPFVVRDGLLVSLGNPRGHLITDDQFQNYRLEVQYRFAGKPGNCGVLIHASKPRALYKMFPQSIEVQMHHQNAGDFWCIVEDIKVPDMVKRRGPKEKWGITEGKARRILNLTDDSEKPVGEWNTMVIECLGNEVKVWVNGDLVNQGFDCTASKGHIAIQAEGSEVEFRKIELTPITKLTADAARK